MDENDGFVEWMDEQYAAWAAEHSEQLEREAYESWAAIAEADGEPSSYDAWLEHLDSLLPAD